MSPAERDREILLRLREVLLNMTDNMTFITLRIRRDLVRLLEIIVDAVIKENPHTISPVFITFCSGRRTRSPVGLQHLRS